MPNGKFYKDRWSKGWCRFGNQINVKKAKIVHRVFYLFREQRKKKKKKNCTQHKDRKKF